jgi:hypothetical protein
VSCNERLEMAREGSDIAGDQHAARAGGDAENCRVEGSVSDMVLCVTPVDGRFPPDEAPPDVRVQVGVSLESDFQAYRGARSSCVWRNRSSIPCGIGFFWRSSLPIASWSRR